MTFRPFPIFLVFSLAFVSCATHDVRSGVLPVFSAPRSSGSAKSFAAEPEANRNDKRLRIYQASQTIEVADVSASAQKAEELTLSKKGYVETSSAGNNGETYATLTLRVPETDFRGLMDEFAALGHETNRRSTSEDTTIAYIDLEARLKNTAALRDRLRGLLNSAKTVKETLEIEKELARVQSDLDAMQGKLQLMQSQIRMAKIELTLKTKGIPGPLGAAGKGLWWSIRKLFVLK